MRVAVSHIKTVFYVSVQLYRIDGLYALRVLLAIKVDKLRVKLGEVKYYLQYLDQIYIMASGNGLES